MSYVACLVLKPQPKTPSGPLCQRLQKTGREISDCRLRIQTKEKTTNSIDNTNQTIWAKLRPNSASVGIGWPFGLIK